MNIPQAAVDAALIYMTHNPNLSNSGHEVEAVAMLEAAMPHIRKQIAKEILEQRPFLELYSVDDLIYRDGMERAARIAEGENK